jgi:xanthine/uracil/vitamin C permease (AzgA family)
MVKWENDKNAYILGAALGASNVTISNEIAETIRAGWRKFLIFVFTLPSPLFFFPVLSRCICYTYLSILLTPP